MDDKEERVEAAAAEDDVSVKIAAAAAALPAMRQIAASLEHDGGDDRLRLRHGRPPTSEEVSTMSRTPDVMKGGGLRSSWVPGGCWGCHVQHDVGGPYV